MRWVIGFVLAILVDSVVQAQGFAPVGGGVAVQGGQQGQVAGGQQGQVAGGQQGQVAGGVGGNAGGIDIDAQGVVSPKFGQKQSLKLTQAKMQALAEKTLNADVNQTSELRKISLVRMEQTIEKHLTDGTPIPVEMQFLAGLTRIDYVFLDEDGKDLVLAGPAEGFAPDDVGRVRGTETGRPPLRLDDLMIALRTLERTSSLGCSIDPDEQRLAQLQQWVRANSTPASPAVAAQRYRAMAQILGLQNVRVWGIPADSHFGVALVEADWRMKLMSLGLERPPVKGFQSQLAGVGLRGNSMQRFWITPLYDAFQTNDDKTAYAISGQRAQVMSQEEYVDGAGKRSDAPFTRVSTQRFAKNFTEKFPEIAATTPVFAELQNQLDLVILAALMKKDRLPQRVGWRMSLFLDEQRAHFARIEPPKHVSTAANFKRVGQTLVGLIGGGVIVDPMQTIRNAEFSTETAGRLNGIRKGALEEAAPESHPWWWD
ncbi:DUF1598 domain-containing protein [Thalassoroseus pseudoceratinae]|uniref:DUF1598 domain-containing protein n=1 Tax=Thalassoroseus pseudoceratinae TaxID=2713176 RepID=UPI0014223B86|nr:DUF1598 domain-containing protein [Thalassoroseus pseudoceratinae]